VEQGGGLGALARFRAPARLWATLFYPLSKWYDRLLVDSDSKEVLMGGAADDFYRAMAVAAATGGAGVVMFLARTARAMEHVGDILSNIF
jgi:hypothetical protein